MDGHPGAVSHRGRTGQNPAYRPTHRQPGLLLEYPYIIPTKRTAWWQSANRRTGRNGDTTMSGTMRERPPGSKRWELRAYTGRDSETGKPRQVSRTFRGGKREDKKALDHLLQ